MPGVPPSVNNYVRHTKSGIHYLTKEAIYYIWKFGECIPSDRIIDPDFPLFIVIIHIFLGSRQRLDVDNASKMVLDCLAKYHGVIRTDSRVKRVEIEKFRDKYCPRLEIWVGEWIG